MICDNGTHCRGVNALDTGARTVMVAMTDAAMAYLLDAVIILLLLDFVKSHLNWAITVPACLNAALCSRRKKQVLLNLSQDPEARKSRGTNDSGEWRMSICLFIVKQVCVGAYCDNCAATIVAFLLSLLRENREQGTHDAGEQRRRAG